MAKIKLPAVSYKEIGEKGARYALDEVEYNGLTIRQWAEKITGGEYAPVVHGRWNKCAKINRGDVYKCLVCDNDEFEGIRFKYCPNCGAKMDEEVGGNGK